MTGLEKMKSQILNEAELSAKKILDEAKQDAEKVMWAYLQKIRGGTRSGKRKSSIFP